MPFNNAFDAIYGLRSSSAAIRQFSNSNANLRRFNRTPIGRAATSTASLLTKLSSQSESNEFHALFSNSASSLGRLNASSGNAAFSIFSNLIEGLIAEALTRRKVTTTVAESERSRQAQKLWNSSRSDQDAMLANMVQRGLGEQ